ncbi:MAG TPA: GNAT family N-acetyltransferase [Galbitalea sp.]
MKDFPSPIIRPYRPEDRSDCYDVCIRTAEVGGDARGMYSSDDLMGDIFFGPYVDLDPEMAYVVDTGSRVSGYVIATADVREFVRRYRAELLPVFAAKYPYVDPSTSHEAHMVALGHNPERTLGPQLDEYPAHLHIDLLPELQRKGLGRQLMDTIRGALAERGVPGVHLEMVTANTRARSFYDRLGFRELSSGDGLAILAISTT